MLRLLVEKCKSFGETVNMESEGSSETPVPFYHNTPEDNTNSFGFQMTMPSQKEIEINK
jgi:hypothetical protein